MSSSLNLSSFVVKVGEQLWDLGGDFQFDFDVQANTIQEVLQNVFNTLSVRLGTQRLQRTFGLDMSFIDMPGNIATLQAQVAILRDVSYWEPRAVFKKIEFTLDPFEVLAGVYRLYCELDINLDPVFALSLYAPPGEELSWVIDGPMDGTPDAARVALENVTL
jgi:phage baseplate assembly protein W